MKDLFSKSFALWCSLFFTFCIHVALRAQEKPNILLIIVDDAGYHDFGFQGSKTFKTPHIDALAKSGVIFSQAYVTAAVCGPSRAGLITGRYQQRFGFEENNVPGIMSNSGLTGDDMGLPVQLNTMADYMKKLGYTNGYIGKWHLGNADRYHPIKRGFDHFVGFRGGARSFYPFGANNPIKKAANRIEYGFGNYKEPTRYLTHFFADEAVGFIQKNKNTPFFLTVSFNAVHTPLEIEKNYPDKFPTLKGKRRKLANMTASLDAACGKIIAFLEHQQIRDNTLVFFINDNGGPTDANSASNYPLSGTKANHLEGGIRIPFVVSWPDVIDSNGRYDFPVSTLDILPTMFSVSGGDLESIQPLDGVNLLPYILGKNNSTPHHYLYWKKESRAAIRHKNWKLLRFPDRPAQLYDIHNDISEQRDLASQHPEIVKSMYKKLFEWEAELERPLWQLNREWEVRAMERMDAYH